jgi:hypothetical protein
MLTVVLDDEVAQFWAFLECKRNEVQHVSSRVALSRSVFLVLLPFFAELLSGMYITCLKH